MHGPRSVAMRLSAGCTLGELLHHPSCMYGHTGQTNSAKRVAYFKLLHHIIYLILNLNALSLLASSSSWSPLPPSNKQSHMLRQSTMPTDASANCDKRYDDDQHREINIFHVEWHLHIWICRRIPPINPVNTVIFASAHLPLLLHLRRIAHQATSLLGLSAECS